MLSDVQATNNFNLIQARVAWIEKVEFQVGGIVAPFTDTVNIIKAGVLRLAWNSSIFRENLWLHSSSIIGALIMLSYELGTERLPVRPNAPSHITTLKTAARTVVEQILGLTDQLHYEETTGCKQTDGSSCGV
ncbi:hypothetical protein PHMEG_00017831 [Phytophthora megakarya]|uniref:Uncharacterized protein n=1 Tax=Phytophthora megakarya TaxID=4795 RepID=A0A225VX40_9STRA|nr:hypothetical protein PHMEG_00017831 [Phytophthora megakarya]